MTYNNKRRKTTNSDVQRTLSDIPKLKGNGKSDIEIRDILDISVRMYQKYMKRIHEQDKQVWLSITSRELESELLRLKYSLEDTYRRALEISEKEDSDSILAALEIKDNARVNIVKLLVEGPHYIKQVHEKLVTDTETNKINHNNRTSLHTK